MVPALPILNKEFAYFFRRCRPPGGWPHSIGVANSAGPDSTCLLFLLTRLLDSPKGPEDVIDVHSFHVDHGLQDVNKKMAEVAHANAIAFGATPHTIPITWSDGVYPPKPSPGDALESIARQARNRSLFNSMRQAGVGVVAYGHHADDQVETSVMRWTSGSSPFGLAGMQPVRRWGMGSSTEENGLENFGLEGLKTWIIRPLLPVSKDRILATCHHNKLEYVDDPTNFQPDLTLRNSIRKAISDFNQLTAQTQPDTRSSGSPSNLTEVGTVLRHKLADLRHGSEVRTIFPYELAGNVEDLRDSVRVIGMRVQDVEDEATLYLNRNRVSSPPGTFMLATSEHLFKVNNPLIRSAMVLRILRYISPEPWGSLQAQSQRRGESIQRIVSRIFTPWEELPLEHRTPLVAGAQVMWKPMRILRGGRFRHFHGPEALTSLSPGERVGWLATRAPPVKEREASLTADVTDAIRAQWARRVRDQEEHSLPPVEYLWDCRFLLRFYTDRAPKDLMERIISAPPGQQSQHRLLIRPDKAALPTVCEYAGDTNIAVLRKMPDTDTLLPLSIDLEEDGSEDWIKFEFARPFSDE